MQRIIVTINLKHYNYGKELERRGIRCAYCGVTEEWQTLDMFDGNRSNYTDRNFAPATVRYLRLFVVAPTQGQDSAARIYEFEVY